MPPPIKLPVPYAKMSWQELMANFGADLTAKKYIAEGDAVQLQTVFKKQPEAIISAQSKYTRAVGKFNGASTYIQTLLRTGKTPKGVPPNLDDARDAYEKFEAEVDALLTKAIHGGINPLTKMMLASAVPSVADIAKIFDVIMKAVEWFIKRRDDERSALADMLERTMLREWDHAGDPLPAAKDGTATKKATKKAGGGG